MKKVIFSGIQPSGNLHIGNYLGAIKQWVELQETGEYELIFCIVDLHAITIRQQPEELKAKTLEVAALYLASGIDPNKSNIFIQSENPDHPYLAWLFDCITPVGWMNRMTQFKDKRKKQKDEESVSVGLFNYPALMAADILLYDADLVPVGEDQKQHLEFTSDIAKRFNSIYSDTFKIPKARFNRMVPRVMSLQSPLIKMSKSDTDPRGTINMLDSKDEIAKKIKGAVTDSKPYISLAGSSPAFKSLATIYAGTAPQNLSFEDIGKKFEGKGYEEFKNNLLGQVIDTLSPIQDEYHRFLNDKATLNGILKKGINFAKNRSSPKLKEVREKMGLA